MRPIVVRLLLPLLCLALTGCATGAERSRAAGAAAAAFERALADRDTALGCETLAPGTREELEQEQPCPTALQGLQLTGAREPAQAAVVYGSQARVVYPHDSVFLALFTDGWKVTAAGCTPRQGRPYRCELKGD
ncbi:hypothetical protein [Streptomyces sp. 3211]|uniref:hypothetical protein n=1 Tax=Streptomyces sp. 3211 TaxID=1964449 RepID=UPI0009A5453D|nr:hypothetical protein [Streptomyces sp. 3211]